MEQGSFSAAFWKVVRVVGGVGLLVICGWGIQGERDASAASSGITSGAQTLKARSAKVPRLSKPPANPKLMQVYYNTQDKREWIYDGKQWVPRDGTVDAFYSTSAVEGTATLQSDGLAPLSSEPTSCLPTGAHAKHKGADCTACHAIKGALCFSGAAVGAGQPSFDAPGKTCSSIGCHGSYSGTFEYGRWDWGCECWEPVSVAYSGSGGNTASWYSATPLGCSSCHGNPPASYAWHASNHGLPFVSNGRSCETCHPDAISQLIGGKVVGVSINPTQATRHANGQVQNDVQARFTSKCFNCH